MGKRRAIGSVIDIISFIIDWKSSSCFSCSKFIERETISRCYDCMYKCIEDERIQQSMHWVRIESTSRFIMQGLQYMSYEHTIIKVL